MQPCGRRGSIIRADGTVDEWLDKLFDGHTSNPGIGQNDFGPFIRGNEPQAQDEAHRAQMKQYDRSRRLSMREVYDLVPFGSYGGDSMGGIGFQPVGRGSDVFVRPTHPVSVPQAPNFPHSSMGFNSQNPQQSRYNIRTRRGSLTDASGPNFFQPQQHQEQQQQHQQQIFSISQQTMSNDFYGVGKLSTSNNYSSLGANSQAVTTPITPRGNSGDNGLQLFSSQNWGMDSGSGQAALAGQEIYPFEDVDLETLYPGERNPEDLKFFLQGSGHGQSLAPIGGASSDFQPVSQNAAKPRSILSACYDKASSLFRAASSTIPALVNFARRGSIDASAMGASDGSSWGGAGGQHHQQLQGQGGTTDMGSQGNGGGQLLPWWSRVDQPQTQWAGADAEAIQREQFKQDAIEVASFLHQVKTASFKNNLENATVRKPEPVEERAGIRRRTQSGTVYPIPSPFEQNSNVGICMLFPPGLDSTPIGASITVDLEQFFLRCPIDGCVTSVRWADSVRGEERKKKEAGSKAKATKAAAAAAAASAAGFGHKTRAANKFDHCCFVSMHMPGGFEHVSVKLFKTGRLQTAGCRDGDMSLEACKVVAESFRRIALDGNHANLLRGGPELSPGFLHQMALDAPKHVRLEKQSILGVFDLGFRDQGFSVDMDELRLLLSHPDNSDRICNVNLPKADEKLKVKRFQGLGVYVNKDCLPGAENNVFVNVFPTGKCTVTAASTVEQAQAVAGVIGKLVIDLFVQCRKRDMERPASSKRRKTT